MSVGIRGRVTYDDTRPQPLRLRVSPGGDRITSMAEGTEFTVTGGPQCQGSYTWWQLQLPDGRSGWAAEGDFSLYFMEPITADQTGDALVDTSRLNVRAQPGTGAQILGVVLRGQGVDVVARLADNSWFEIRTPSGLQGWAAGSFLNLRINLSGVRVKNVPIVNP
ncbi:MAG: SH3 domain-containing protein, partial [bacterium]|nr:SH3 domain-containing protein [bacterium]